MPTHPLIPPLLSTFINPPTASLTLLTSTLGATTNWLVLRFIHAALKREGRTGENEVDSTHESTQSTTVVLVSWLRDTGFWKDGGRKLGTNFNKVQIIDALHHSPGFDSDCLSKVEDTILKAIKDAAGAATREEREVLLVLDGLDFLLAATGCPAFKVLEMIGELREHVHSTIVTTCVDLAIIHSSETPLEPTQKYLVMSTAHQATSVASARGLDTGFAKDISGVISIRRGVEAKSVGDTAEENEYLYFVEADGGARVFERGI